MPVDTQTGSVHENMQSLIEQSGSVRKYAKDEIIYLQGDTAQSLLLH